MRTVQAAEAETHLAELLREVEEGESVAIARDGKAVAHLVPVSPEKDAGSRREAVEEFMRRQAGWEPARITAEEIVAWIREGRRM